ncbi:MAG: hypothetical protein ACYC3X_18325 [Pirellulaceae bacterium]
MFLGRLTALAIAALVLFGTVGVALRYYARHGERMGVGDTAWRLTYFVECDAQRAAAELRIASPADTLHCRVFRQDFRQENLRLDPRGRSSAQSREIVALAEKSGPCQSTLRFDLRLNPRANWAISGTPVTLTANERAAYLKSTAEIQVRSQSVIDTLAGLRVPSQDSSSSRATQLRPSSGSSCLWATAGFPTTRSTVTRRSCLSISCPLAAVTTAW